MQDHAYVSSPPRFLTVFLQLLHGKQYRYTSVTNNPCLCNSHSAGHVSATTRWEPILDMELPYFWPCLCNNYMWTNTRYTNPCLGNSHISVRVYATTTWEPKIDILVWLVIHAYVTPTFLAVCATTTWEPKIDILVWLVIHACATPTFLTVFVQLRNYMGTNGNSYKIYLCVNSPMLLSSITTSEEKIQNPIQDMFVWIVLQVSASMTLHDIGCKIYVCNYSCMYRYVQFWSMQEQIIEQATLFWTDSHTRTDWTCHTYWEKNFYQYYTLRIY